MSRTDDTNLAHVPEAERDGDTGRAATQSLVAEIERHLLRAMLTLEQRASLDAHGWFPLRWPEQWLLLVIHADRLPTVEAYQLPPRPAAPGGSGSSTHDHGDGAPGPSALSYLCSWDIRRARIAPDGRVLFPSLTTTPLGQARRVMEAYRRGALRALLEASEEKST